MWNDEYLLPEGQFVYSENLDIYREPRYIQLAVKPTNYKTGLTDMVYLIATGQGSDMSVDREVYFALENKDIIDASWVVRFDGSTIRPYSGLFSHWRSSFKVGNGLTFWDFVNGIFVPLNVTAPASVPDWNRNTWDLDWTNYAVSLGGNGETRPYYTIGNQTFFGETNDHVNIAITSASGGMPWVGSGIYWPGYPTVTQYAQWIDQPGDVVFASVHSDSVWSGSTNKFRLTTELSGLSVVAWVSDEWVKQVQVDKYSKVLHGVNKNNLDIIIAGDVKEYHYDTDNFSPSSADYSSIYIYNHYGFWAWAQQLIARSRYFNNIETAFGNHGITYYLAGIYGVTDYNWAKINDLVYCISNKDDVGLIYAYGKSAGGLNDWWSVIISKNSSGKAMKRIGCLYRNFSKNGFYYSYEDEDGVFGIDYYDDISIETPTSFQPSGKIFIRTDDGGDMSEVKEVKELRCGIYVPEDTTIKISYILDNNWVEKEYQTITHTTQGTTDYKKYRGNEPVKWFKCISWFAELTSSGTKSPNIANFNYDLWIVQ